MFFSSSCYESVPEWLNMFKQRLAQRFGLKKGTALLIYPAESYLFSAEISRKGMLRNKLAAHHIFGFLLELASQVSEQSRKPMSWLRTSATVQLYLHLIFSFGF